MSRMTFEIADHITRPVKVIQVSIDGHVVATISPNPQGNKIHIAGAIVGVKQHADLPVASIEIELAS